MPKQFCFYHLKCAKRHFLHYLRVDEDVQKIAICTENLLIQFFRMSAFFYRSLSLSPKANTNHEPTNEYNGVHHVFELEGPIASGTRIVFMHGDADNVLFGDEAVIYLKKIDFTKKKVLFLISRIFFSTFNFF